MHHRLRPALIPLALGVILGGVVLSLGVRAGDLAPPPGAVAPTDRVAINPIGLTLPYTITQPGSYVLTGPIDAPPGATNGIVIDADDVTLDLNGFTIDGNGAVGGGIFAFPGRARLTIRNGVVREWGTCVALLSASECAVTEVRTATDTAGGILVGPYSIVTRCTATASGNIGIQASDGCVISHCTAHANTGIGIFAGQGCSITHCASYSNNAGVWSGAGSVIADCTAYSNTNDGIHAGNALIRGNASRANGTQINGLGTSTLIENH